MARGKSLRPRRGFFSGGRSAAKRERYRRSYAGFRDRGLRIEPLEDRRMLATFVVTSGDDLDMMGATIDGSLRWAVEQANDNDEADVIVFADQLVDEFGIPIFLNEIRLEQMGGDGGQIEITDNLAILGPGSRKLTIRAAGGNRLFSINDGQEDEQIGVTIQRLTLSGGSARGDDEDGEGGTIRNVESLTILDSVVTGGSANIGGGVFVGESGSLSLARSVMSGNSADFGGAIGIGGFGEDANDSESDRNASLTVQNSTLRGNSADRGGAIYVRDGGANIRHSTITGNTAGVFEGELPSPADGEDPVPVMVYAGGGIFGRSYFETDYIDPESDPPPLDSQVNITITHSIVWGNEAGMPDGLVPNDVGAFPAVGEYPMAELVTSEGYNIVGVNSANFALGAGDQIDVDPMLMPMSWYGGETNVYLPMEGSPAIDAGDPMVGGGNEQRGNFFVRTFDGDGDGVAVVDIGASEVQDATFLVNELNDEFDDGQYVTVSPFGGYGTGDFFIREAIDFSAANPGLDTISFDSIVNSRVDPSPSADPTVWLTNGALTLDHSVNVVGPTGFHVEIDASGSDPTRDLNNGDGSSVFVTDQPVTLPGADPVTVRLEGITVMGGDVAGFGGGVQANTNLQVVNATLKDNAATEVGGGVFIQFGDLLLESSTFHNNRAGVEGGGVYIGGNFDGPSTAAIANSTISGNTSGSRGGGIANAYSTLRIDNSTVTLNTSTSTRGSGVSSSLGDLGTVTEIRSSIISGNTISDIDFFQGGNTVVSLGYNLVGGGNAITSFNQSGDITDVFDPMLHPLTNTGGQTATHYPLKGSPAIDAGPVGTSSLITPIEAISSTATDDQFAASRLVDDSGLSEPPTDANRQSVTHAAVDEFNAWSTAESAGPGMDYFSGDVEPRLIFRLDSARILTGVLLWGYPNPGPSGDEARVLQVDFSIDGGRNYYAGTQLIKGLTGEQLTEISFGESYLADTVRITVTDNFFGVADPTVFPPTDPPTLLPGGSRVGLGEVKFIGYDQRGEGFLRVADGDEDGEARQDIGSYELQRLTLDASAMGFAGAVDLSNRNPLIDTVMFSQNGSASTGGATISDSTFVFGNGPFFTQLFGSLTVDDGDDGSLIDVEMSGMQFQGASGAQGAITSRENLLLDDTRVIGNSTTGLGAGINHALGDLTINDSTITGNRATEVGSQGGGLFAMDANVHITGYTTISGNSTLRTKGHGGGIAVQGSYLLVDDGTVITGNITPAGESDGGGIYAVDSTVVLGAGTVLSGNTTTGSNSEGGAIYARNSDVFMDEVLLNLNTTTGTGAEGGGVYLENSSAVIFDSLLAQNRTLGDESSGGAIFSMDSEVEIYNTAVVSSTVGGVNTSGGAIYQSGGSLYLESSEVAENSADWSDSLGGGIYTATDLFAGDQWTRIVNSTVSGNSAGRRGGGVFNAGGLTEIWHSTITDNSVPFNNVGAGVASLGVAASTETLIASSIVAGNQGVLAGDATDVDSVDGLFQNSFVSLGYNLIGAGNAASAFSGPGDQTGVLDPKLGPLAMNGGPTRTHAVEEDSPAINAGDPNFTPTDFDPALDFDQRGAGFPRVLQGRLDVGAFESNFAQTGPADYNDDGMTEGFDFLLWQRGFGTTSGASKADGDANGDGAVNGEDQAIWEATFGTIGPVESASVASEASSVEASLAAASVDSPERLEPALTVVPVGDSAGASIGRDRYYTPAVRDQLLAEQAMTARDQGIDRWLEESDAPHHAGENASLTSREAPSADADAGDEAFRQLGTQLLRSQV